MDAIARLKTALKIIAQKLDFATEVDLQRMLNVKALNGQYLSSWYFYRPKEQILLPLGRDPLLRSKIVQNDLNQVGTRQCTRQHLYLSLVPDYHRFLPSAGRQAIGKRPAGLLPPDVAGAIK